MQHIYRKAVSSEEYEKKMHDLFDQAFTNVAPKRVAFSKFVDILHWKWLSKQVFFNVCGFDLERTKNTDKEVEYTLYDRKKAVAVFLINPIVK
jgi:hypothetical protein